MSDQVTLNSDIGPISVPRAANLKAVDPSERSRGDKRRRRSTKEERDAERDQVIISETARHLEEETAETPEEEVGRSDAVTPTPAHDDTARQMEHNIWAVLQHLGVSPDPHDIDSLRASLGIDGESAPDQE